MRRTERGIDRFVFFTDAVVAVAITLLVLPLIDTASNIGGASVPEYIGENFTRIIAFVLSFAVVGRFWISHHQFIENITDYNRSALWLNMILTLLLRTLYVHKPEMLTADGLHIVRIGLIDIRLNVALLSIALTLSITVPQTGIWTLLLLVLSSPIARLIRNKGWREPAAG